MTGEHYFSREPSGPFATRRIAVSLGGREVEVTTSGSIFSPDHVDQGTRVLLSAVPLPPPRGNLLDLGCGWGPIAISLAFASPEASIWAVDVNDRALALTRANADQLSILNMNTVRPEDVPVELTFAAIWSNPPIRVGKAELHAMLEHWLPRLEARGEAWLVVQKNLGGDSLHRWLDERFAEHDISREETSKGFRVLKVAAP
jgi:16S rRNA G1207 methylase RsmC